MLLPLGDDQPVQRPVYVCWLIIGICVMLYAYSMTIPDDTARSLFVRQGALVPATFFGDRPPGLFAFLAGLFPLISHQYLHFDPWQLGLNIVMIFYFGRTLERRCGGLRFALFYSLCGAAAGYCQVDLWGPESKTALYGASGAVAGILGGYLSLVPEGRIRILSLLLVLKTFHMTVWVFIILWFFAQGMLLALEMALGFTFVTLAAGLAIGLAAIHLFRVKAFDPQPDEVFKPRLRTVYDDLYREPPPPTKSWDE